MFLHNLPLEDLIENQSIFTPFFLPCYFHVAYISVKPHEDRHPDKFVSIDRLRQKIC
ncbi:hypothetical protein Sjap_017275 [Stephania japonica]|uniref:Uncharacterized protein n=1 Tax=Stephania japonica TaxID=461633 RepID=A0AAP0I5Y7_9MAGN